MRNVFDQYKQPENRLTHALACCLHHDQKLMKSFLTDLLGLIPPCINQLNIALQSLPQRLEDNLPTSNPKRVMGSGLPDMIIYDDMGWCLFIESKVMSNICKNQIDRHFATLQKRGYTLPVGVIISIDDDANSPSGCSMLTWSSVYKWLCSFDNKSFWARETKSYFEILENNMIEEKYLNERTITEFMGIPFNEDNALTYEEGKRVLKLLTKCLKQRKQLDPLFDVDYDSGRRSFSKGSTIWDTLSLNFNNTPKQQTKTPHFTFGLNTSHLEIMLTFPDKINKSILPSWEEALPLLATILKNFGNLGIMEELYSPKIKLVQRHYPHRSKPIIDGKMEFDLRTIPGIGSTENSKVKKQAGWIEGFYSVLQAKKANIQIQVGISLANQHLSTLDAESCLQLVEQCCNSMIDFYALIKTRL